MPRHDIMTISRLQSRAEAMVSLSARACAQAHLTYELMLSDGHDIEPTLRGLRSKLASARREINDLVEQVNDMLGEQPATPTPNSSRSEPDDTTALPYDQLVAATRDAGEITNARAQKLLGITPREARKLINRMADEGVIVRAGRKLFKVAQPVPVGT